MATNGANLSADPPDVLVMLRGFVNSLKERGIVIPKPDNFETDLIGSMKLWGSSPKLGMSVDASTEAKMQNIAQFLAGAIFGTEPCPEPKDRLKLDEVGMLHAFAGLVCTLGGVLVGISQLPASSGYEPLLKQNGFDPISARGMAHLIVRAGKREAKEQQLRRNVVKAIRTLVKPSSRRKSLLSQARFLLQAAEDSSIVDTICCEVGLREMDLLPLLQAMLEGKPINQERLSELGSRLGPALHTPKGPKITAASSAHEFILNPKNPVLMGGNAYTWSEIKGDFTDPLTHATRQEFGEPNFDPRPARRRVKARKPATTG
jgi:hypothetical protein